MKQKLQLQIPAPCHEDWNKMSETQQGRYCMSCCKEVVDFSVMSDKEILAHISKASSNICGRVSGEQLNRDLIASRQPDKIGWRYWVSLAASFMLIASKTDAQIGKVLLKPATCKPSVTKKEKTPVIQGMIGMPLFNNKIQIHGRITDENKNPVPFASVRIKGSNAGVPADAEGNFILNVNVPIEDVDILISSVGYESKTITGDSLENIKSSAPENGVIKIDIDNIILNLPRMKEVVVIADNVLTGRAGGVCIGMRVTRIEKAKSKFKDVIGINEIKVYPNPITSNSLFNINLNLKNQGEYNIQFTDVSGKIISSRQLTVFSKNQLESFNSNMFRSSGVYFVTVFGKQNSKLYTTKLLVQ